MTQGSLADAAGQDHKGRTFTSSRIANYEHGTRAMDLEIVKQLSEILGVDPAWLACFIDDDDQMKPTERALLQNYRATDERGRRLISRVAEEELPNPMTRQAQTG